MHILTTISASFGVSDMNMNIFSPLKIKNHVPGRVLGRMNTKDAASEISRVATSFPSVLSNINAVGWMTTVNFFHILKPCQLDEQIEIHTFWILALQAQNIFDLRNYK